MSWLSIKAKLITAGAFLVTVLAFIFRFQMVKDQRDKAIKRANNERARANQAEEINDAETQLDQEFSDFERESRRDIKDGKMPDNIRKRNNW